MTWIYVWSLSQTFRRFHQSKWSPYVDPLWLRNVDGTVRLPPITQPNRVFCRYKSVSFDWWIICSPHSDASVDPALNKMSIGPGLWNLGSAGWRFLGIWIIDLRVDLGPMSLLPVLQKTSMYICMCLPWRLLWSWYGALQSSLGYQGLRLGSNISNALCRVIWPTFRS